MKIFETFECSGQILSNSLCQFWNNNSIPLQILYPSSVSWKIIPLYFFSSNNIYLLKRRPLKYFFFRLSSARVKFCQIPYANFEMMSRYLSKFFIPLQFHEGLLLCTFLAQTIYTLLKRSTLKWKFWGFQVLGSKFIKFLMPVLKWQVNSSSNFASFFIAMTHNFSVDFKLRFFLLWIKGSHQHANFETFNCSGEYLPYSSCHFPNHKSVFLQILHHSSVSWKITPLYFFRQTLNTLQIFHWNNFEHFCV